VFYYSSNHEDYSYGGFFHTNSKTKQPDYNKSYPKGIRFQNRDYIYLERELKSFFYNVAVAGCIKDCNK
jgi:hypothetical protein